jgi:hypothetical protein
MRAIEITEFNPSGRAPHSDDGRFRSTRNWSRELGLAGTLSLHGLLVHFLVLGSVLHQPRPPEPQGAGAHRIESAKPVEEFVIVTLNSDHRREDTDPLKQTASFAPALNKPSITGFLPDFPPIDVAAAEETASQPSANAGDPEVRALMLGRYTAQISARIARAWIRPRTTVNDSEHFPRSKTALNAVPPAADGTFSCLVQIRQDALGNVQEVLLLQCNGTATWQRSLVIAINQSSPLPAPPTPSVFTGAVNIAFEAQEYRPGMPPEGYEIELKQEAQMVKPPSGSALSSSGNQPSQILQ